MLQVSVGAGMHSITNEDIGSLYHKQVMQTCNEVICDTCLSHMMAAMHAMETAGCSLLQANSQSNKVTSSRQGKITWTLPCCEASGLLSLRWHRCALQGWPQQWAAPWGAQAPPPPSAGRHHTLQLLPSGSSSSALQPCGLLTLRAHQLS